jgi:hypothetical protein
MTLHSLLLIFDFEYDEVLARPFLKRWRQNVTFNTSFLSAHFLSVYLRINRD